MLDYSSANRFYQKCLKISVDSLSTTCDRIKKMLFESNPCFVSLSLPVERFSSTIFSTGHTDPQ